MMNWQQLLSSKRFGMESYYDGRKHDRTDFQRDYDRLIFSSPFRRLQNKTQVFPLPGSVFVHNRLTHSLEVSCVGRSLGDRVGRELSRRHTGLEAGFSEMGSIVSAACLAHDLGNPPFGHSGEKAISSYFTEGKGPALLDKVEQEGSRVSDFVHFEGNANSIRLLTHRFNGRREGGFVLTYSTLASIVKYPYSSELAGKKGKFGFFSSEEESFRRIAEELGIIRLSDHPLSYVRYPLVYLVEAADDICYQIMDLEDAHKLRLLSTEQTMTMLLHYFTHEKQTHLLRVMGKVEDVNEQIAYLRSSVIGLLVEECCRVFIDSEDAIMKGEFEGSLIDHISSTPHTAYEECTSFAFRNIYKAKDVVDVELAGYRIIGFLLDTFINAMFSPGHVYSKLVFSSFPEQFVPRDNTVYAQIQSVIDYVSGMTDIYALDLYRKLTGMNLPAV